MYEPLNDLSIPEIENLPPPRNTWKVVKKPSWWERWGIDTEKSLSSLEALIMMTHESGSISKIAYDENTIYFYWECHYVTPRDTLVTRGGWLYSQDLHENLFHINQKVFRYYKKGVSDIFEIFRYCRENPAGIDTPDQFMKLNF